MGVMLGKLPTAAALRHQGNFQMESSMKTIGLIGGMSWESTVPYYRHINEAVKGRLGGLHSAKVILFSVDFQEIEELQHTGEWGKAGDRRSHGGSNQGCRPAHQRPARHAFHGGAGFLSCAPGTRPRPRCPDSRGT